jgi:hypothetical protein
VYFVTTEGVVETMRRPETIEDVMRMQVWDPSDEVPARWDAAAVAEQRA